MQLMHQYMHVMLHEPAQHPRRLIWKEKLNIHRISILLTVDYCWGHFHIHVVPMVGTATYSHQASLQLHLDYMNLEIE